MKTRKKIVLEGVVQGIGFRPYIYNLATSLSLVGNVLNSNGYAHIEVEGDKNTVVLFEQKLKKSNLDGLKIESFISRKVKSINDKTFKIISSSSVGEKRFSAPPDYAVCEKCLKELFDPDNRRYMYEFISCPSCGPRYSIISDYPYDRTNTSLDKFDMCEQCKAEYINPLDRRFHAQNISCPKCGPKYSLFNTVDNSMEYSNVGETIASLISQAEIIALKDTGGFKLICNAFNKRVISKLRDIKNRISKPFAVMFKDIISIKKYFHLTKAEEKLVLSKTRPIVLLRLKNEYREKFNCINPNLDKTGVILPYSPIHNIIFRYLDIHTEAIVFTSANNKGEPVITDNEKALSKLGDRIKYFALNDLDIHNFTDDSIFMCANDKHVIIRSSRGVIPSIIKLDKKFDKNITALALGSDTKSSFTLYKSNELIKSKYYGDLENPECYSLFKREIKSFLNRLNVKPDVFIADMHPNYFSSRLARELGEDKVVYVQHHKAHALSCALEHSLTDDFIALVYDGTGYGEDGNIWGCELFFGNYQNLKRIGHLHIFILPTGEAAVKHVNRCAYYFMKTCGYENNDYLLERINIDKKYTGILNNVIKEKKNVVHTTSCGRLFDAAASLTLGIDSVSYDAEAVMKFEALARKNELNEKCYDFLEYNIGDGYIVNPLRAMNQLMKDLLNKIPIEIISQAFHRGFINACCDVIRKISQTHNVKNLILSGGVFQNSILLTGISAMLEEECNVYIPTKFSLNDEGISPGQIFSMIGGL